MKNQVRQLFADADQTERELLPECCPTLIPRRESHDGKSCSSVLISEAAARAAQTRQRWIIAVAIAVVVIGAGVLIYLTTRKPAAASPSQSSSAPTISAKQYAAAPAMEHSTPKDNLAAPRLKMAKGGEFVDPAVYR